MRNTQPRLAVLGTGSWGTAQANHLCQSGCLVTLWGRDSQVLTDIASGFNRRYFGDIPLAPGLLVQADIRQAVTNQDAVVFAVPAKAVRSTAQAIAQVLATDTVVISTAKGLESQSLMRMSEVLAQELGRLERIAVLSGPSFAKEVLLGLPTAVTIASANPKTAQQASSYYHHNAFRTYSSSDIVGVELGGVLKNVIAVAAGITDGFQMGYNSRAALLTRGLAEIRRLVMAAGGRSSTVGGLSGLGDLMLTATGDLSRNRQVGLQLGRGMKLEQILANLGQVAEGIAASKCCWQLAQNYGVDTPIIEETMQIIEGSHSLETAVHNLLSRTPKSEN